MSRARAPRPVAVGVCGFPRCGSSMTMRMLHAGGIDPVPGSSPRSYELANLGPAVQALATVDLGRHAIKLLDTVCWDASAIRRDVRWRFIWLDRDPVQQARSHVKFSEWYLPDLPLFGADSEAAFAASYAEDRPAAIRKLDRLGEMLVVSFEAVLARPLEAAETIGRFLCPDFPGFDARAAASVVHARGPECLPSLAFERGLEPARVELPPPGPVILCLAHMCPEPCSTCRAYIAAGL